MTHVLIIDNPFEPFKNLKRETAMDGLSVREWLAEYFGPGFNEFDRPTVCQYNGELIIRAEWETRRFKDGDVVAFVTVPQGIELIIIAIVAVVVAVGAYLLMPDPKIPTDNTQSPDSVYTLRGQTNRFRPNEPVEVQYGRCRHWPTYASRPYSEYVGNLQYQYSLFCLGQGEFNIHATQLDDTSTDDFTEIELEIVPPGATVNLVESSVFTALEVSNIELLGPNEDDYTGISGPFNINDFENPIHRIAVDISFPQGLYKMSDEGDLESQSVTLLFEYREIDETGDPIGTWQTIANPIVTRSDNTPQRITYSQAVPAGRYQVRGQRVSNKPGSTRVASQVRWETVKGYAKSVGSFGNVTMIAMKALATNTLNDSSSKAFNVVSTRKLPTWTPGTQVEGVRASVPIGMAGTLRHPVNGVAGNGVTVIFSVTPDPSPTAPYQAAEVTSIDVVGNEITVNIYPSQTLNFLNFSDIQDALALDPTASALVQLVFPADEPATNISEPSFILAGGVDEVNEPGTWGALTATRNPIWAFCDLFRSVYGAKLSDEFLDMSTLYGLAQTFDTRNDWFDWIFDGSLSIWEAAKMILRVGRTVPIPQGSLITAVRDVAQTLPSAIFNQHNIIKGTLSKKLSMFDFQPFDGVIVEYTDPDTWKTKEVKCVLPGRDGLNLDRVKFPGCTNRNRAFREGMYIQSRREFQRKTVIFQTGLEGHIPAYMDLVSIAHDTLRVGQGGMIIAYDSGTKEMTLSEQVSFATELIVHKIAIRGDDGAILGTPITVTPGSAPNKVILATDPADPLDFSENRVPPLYAFGVAELWAFMGKVSAIRPLDDSTVEITCVNYVAPVYDYEDATTVDAIERKVIRNRTNPTVEWVTIAPVFEKSDRAFIDWQPVPGAVSYILQTSYDEGLTWNPAGNYAAPPVELGTNPGTLQIRVAPFSLNGNVIYTVSEPYLVGSNVTPPPSPELLAEQPAFTGLTASARWNAVTGANGYAADIYAASVLLRTVNTGTAQRVDYTFDEYTADGGTGRAIEFRVKAFNAGGYGTASTLIQTNPVPAAPTALTVGSPTGTDYPASWTYTPVEGDELEFRVYASTTPGFTPGPGNLVATRTVPDATLAAPTRPLYWRVATLDKWGAEESLSDEAEIPA